MVTSAEHASIHFSDDPNNSVVRRYGEINIYIYKKKFFEKKPILVRVVDFVLDSMTWKQSRVYYCIIG